mmetsp:Transcript_13719/g.27073  ORF Transcript_13719/g.27073 Transcript_13719/m.27073 type:complete len:481 (+) Transcript_13719:219-1661(+)
MNRTPSCGQHRGDVDLCRLRTARRLPWHPPPEDHCRCPRRCVGLRRAALLLAWCVRRQPQPRLFVPTVSAEPDNVEFLVRVAGALAVGAAAGDGIHARRRLVVAGHGVVALLVLMVLVVVVVAQVDCILAFRHARVTRHGREELRVHQLVPERRVRRRLLQVELPVRRLLAVVALPVLVRGVGPEGVARGADGGEGRGDAHVSVRHNHLPCKRPGPAQPARQPVEPVREHQSHLHAAVLVLLEHPLERRAVELDLRRRTLALLILILLFLLVLFLLVLALFLLVLLFLLAGRVRVRLVLSLACVPLQLRRHRVLVHHRVVCHHVRHRLREDVCLLWRDRLLWRGRDAWRVFAERPLCLPLGHHRGGRRRVGVGQQHRGRRRLGHKSRGFGLLRFGGLGRLTRGRTTRVRPAHAVIVFAVFQSIRERHRHFLFLQLLSSRLERSWVFAARARPGLGLGNLLVQRLELRKHEGFSTRSAEGA